MDEKKYQGESEIKISEHSFTDKASTTVSKPKKNNVIKGGKG